MRADLLTHPKVVRMSSALRADRLRISGGLFAVWCLFDTHSVDGRLEGYTLEALDDLIGFPGFGSGMQAVGWLEIDGDSLCTPRFEEHNGQSAKRRASETERKRNERKTSAPNADKKRTREEKRREEDTVPNGTDGDAVKPASDLSKDELWKAGKSLLSQSGMPSAQCGSFVGKLVKDYGDQIVVEAVRTAVVSRPADPAEYLKATCMHAAGQRSVAEPAWRAEQRARTHQAAPGVAAGVPADQFFIDMEASDVSPRRLG